MVNGQTLSHVDNGEVNNDEEVNNNGEVNDKVNNDDERLTMMMRG